ncbi:hypothetical protein [Streptosporangium jomthongense]|uniref:Uncharacterized protein n=1 Tax=Streptosporangium jomthongense TaxID=1193683 RepID=A0ABV8FDT5_9ACTN
MTTQSLPAPSGCRWCGLEEREHFQRWKSPVGWHVWTEPTSDQRKERMRERRAASASVETPKETPLTADEWNTAWPVGTPILAWPGSRDAEPLTTATRTTAWTLGSGHAVVSVEGCTGGIFLTHIQPIHQNGDPR